MDPATIQVLVIVVIAYILGSWLISKIFDLSRKKRRKYAQSLYYTGYYCKAGHFIGEQVPVPGTLCQTCIGKGYIKSECPVDSSDPIQITKVIPPYEIYCPIHGTFNGPWRYHINSKQVSLEEWIKHNRYDPAPIPLPTSDPVPANILPQLLDPEHHPLLKDKLGTLSDQIHLREKELQAEIQKRNTLQRAGAPISILIILCLLLITIFGTIFYNEQARRFFFDESIELTTRVTELVKEVETLLSLFTISGVTAAVLAIVIIVLIKRQKGPEGEIDWYDLTGATSFALLVELLMTRFWEDRSLTIFDLLRSVTLQIVPALLFALIYNHRYIKRQIMQLNELKHLRAKIRTAIHLIQEAAHFEKLNRLLHLLHRLPPTPQLGN